MIICCPVLFDQWRLYDNINSIYIQYNTFEEIIMNISWLNDRDEMTITISGKLKNADTKHISKIFINNAIHLFSAKISDWLTAIQELLEVSIGWLNFLRFVYTLAALKVRETLWP